MEVYIQVLIIPVSLISIHLSLSFLDYVHFTKSKSFSSIMWKFTENIMDIFLSQKYTNQSREIHANCIQVYAIIITNANASNGDCK